MENETPIASKRLTIVSWVQISTAIASFITVFFLTGLLSNAEGFSWWMLLVLAIPCLYLAAGIGLLKRKKGFWIFSLILQVLAIFDISIGESLSWTLNPGLELAIFLNLGGLGIGFDFLSAAMTVLLLRSKKEFQQRGCENDRKLDSGSTTHS